MKTATLDDFMALNDQIAALDLAGVPVDVGLGKKGTDTAAILEKINGTVARRVSRGLSLQEALKVDERVIPVPYLCMVQLGIQSGNIYAALEGSNRLAECVDDSRHAFQSAFVYPMIVASLVYVGMIGCSLFFVPTLENIYQSLRIEPESGLHFLQTLRETLPYWIAIPPIVFLLFLARRFRAKSRWRALRGLASPAPRWAPGLARTVTLQRYANFADKLATLVKGGVPLEQGLVIASGACGEARLDQGTRALAATLKQGKVPSDDSPAAMQFPPFLRWALLHTETATGHPETTTGRVRALQMAAGIYRNSAELRAQRMRIMTPIVACVILGGGTTLLYGLALFVPVVQLLHALAS